MSVSYKKLWKLLIDKNVTTDILVKICKALDCDVSDIMEVVKNNKEDKEV